MRKFISLVLLSVLISIFWVACEDYQDETFTITDLDAAACSIYEVDSLSITLPLIQIPDTLTSYGDQETYVDTNGIVCSVNPDSLWSVRFSESPSYGVLQINMAGTKVLYTNENVNIVLSNADGEIAPLVQTVDLATIADCEYIFSRREYELTAGSYLLEFSGEDPRNFKMVILNKE